MTLFSIRGRVSASTEENQFFSDFFAQKNSVTKFFKLLSNYLTIFFNFLRKTEKTIPCVRPRTMAKINFSFLLELFMKLVTLGRRQCDHCPALSISGRSELGDPVLCKQQYFTHVLRTVARQTGAALYLSSSSILQRETR